MACKDHYERKVQVAPVGCGAGLQAPLLEEGAGVEEFSHVSFVAGASRSESSSSMSEDITLTASKRLLAKMRSRPVLLEAFMFTTLWWTSSVTVVMVIKATTNTEAQKMPLGIFPHGFAFTSLVQPTTGLLAWLLSKAMYRRKEPIPPLTRREWAKIICMGVMQGFEIGLTNKALEYLTVSTRTELSSLGVLFMMLSARMWGLEGLGWRRLISMSLLVGGGLMQAQQGGTVNVHHTLRFLGVIMQLTSMTLSSQRWCLAQLIMSHSPPDSALGQMRKLQLLSLILPITGVVCFPLALHFEPEAWTRDQLLQWQLPLRTLVVATALSAMLWAELKLVKLLSAVAFNVLSTVHQTPILLAGVLLQHNHVSIFNGFGFALCLGGALVYAWARRVERKELVGDDNDDEA